MSIAFSAGQIVYTSIRADTIANFLADFLAAATTCGWGSVSITGGYKFTIISKQGLTCKIKLWDSTPPFNNPQLSLQFLSFDETLVGVEHLIFTVAEHTYLLHMNECQIFLARPLDCYFNAIQGGIPFVPNYVADIGDCTDEIYSTLTPLITIQAFWSCSGSNGVFNFRWSHRSDTAYNWDTLHNTDLMNSAVVTNYTGRNRLRIVPVTIAVDIPGFWQNVVSRTRHFTLDEEALVGLAFDPLLVWGSSAGVNEQGRIRGQIYDAFQPSLDTPLDFHINGLFGVDWVNYMHLDPAKGVGAGEGTRFGSLMLALGQPLTSNQEAYVY